MTEEQYSQIHDFLKPGFCNPWVAPGQFNQPGEVRQAWRREVKRWQKAMEKISPKDTGET